MDLMVVLVVFATIVNALILVSGTIILRGCMKMYTEYFKDRSMSTRLGKAEEVEK